MTIVKQIVKEQYGEVKVLSKLDKGNKFDILLNSV